MIDEIGERQNMSVPFRESIISAFKRPNQILIATMQLRGDYISSHYKGDEHVPFLDEIRKMPQVDYLEAN